MGGLECRMTDETRSSSFGSGEVAFRGAKATLLKSAKAQVNKSDHSRCSSYLTGEGSHGFVNLSGIYPKLLFSLALQ